MNRLVRNRCGVSTFELLLMSSLIVVCCILSVSAVGNAMSKPLATVSNILDTSDSGNVATGQAQFLENPRNSGLEIACIVGFGVLAIGLLLFKSPEKKSRKGSTKQHIVDQLQAMISDHDEREITCNNASRKRDHILRALMINAACHNQTSLTAGEIMTQGVTYLTPDMKASQVRKEMKSTGLRHILVCDAGGLRGIISDRDLVKQNARTAAQLMTANPLFIKRSDDVADVIEIILTNRISCLPVVDGRKVIGVVSVTDLSVTLQCILGLFGKLLWTGARD